MGSITIWRTSCFTVEIQMLCLHLIENIFTLIQTSQIIGQPYSDTSSLARASIHPKNNSRCHLCSAECRGYKLAVDHMTSKHSDGNDRHFLCIACSKVFGRRDHLKRHLSGHVENKAPRQRGRRPKELEDEVMAG